MKFAAIILAAGKGKRFCKKERKQFKLLNNIPILEYSVKKFSELTFCSQLIIAVDKENLSRAKNILQHYKKINYVIGGRQRYNSVFNAVKLLRDDIEVVAVHDAARPLFSKNMLLDMLRKISYCDCVIPVCAINDTVKQIEEHKVKTLQRSKLFIVQTPQCFKADALKRIYSEKNLKKCTKKYEVNDDAHLAELNGLKIGVVEGERYNIKLTSKEDFELLKFYASRKYA